MELEWTESKPAIDIPDGSHTGTILEVIDRPKTPDNEFHYLDVVVSIDGTEAKIKYGCPFKMSDKTKLGKLILAFGAKPVIGQKINPETVFLNKKVFFITLKNESGYSEIVEGSLKPLN